MEWHLLMGALLIGLFGSGHCLAMCGGIACSPAFASPGSSNLRSLLLFNGGRLLGYGLIGVTLGLATQWIGTYTQAMTGLRTVAGLLLIAMGLAIGQWWQGVSRIEKLGEPIWKRIAPTAQRLARTPHPLAPIGLGILWGWLPCGLVYSALTWSLSSADARFAGLLMISFGLGTLPSMLSAGMFARHLRRWISHRGVRRVFGVLLIAMGIWTLPQVGALLGWGH